MDMHAWAEGKGAHVQLKPHHELVLRQATALCRCHFLPHTTDMHTTLSFSRQPITIPLQGLTGSGSTHIGTSSEGAGSGKRTHRRIQRTPQSAGMNKESCCISSRVYPSPSPYIAFFTSL